MFYINASLAVGVFNSLLKIPTSDYATVTTKEVIQLNRENSNQGKSKKVRVIGSSSYRGQN